MNQELVNPGHSLASEIPDGEQQAGDFGRSFRQREQIRLQDSYGDAGLLLKQAQELCGLTFVQVDLIEQRVVYSDNYQATMGVAPPGSFDEFANHVHPDDREYLRAMDARIFGTIGRNSASYRMLTPAGELRWIETRAETLGDTAGRPTRVLLTSQDITRHKHSDLEHRAMTNLLMRVQDAARVGPWEWDIVANTATWSAAAWSLFEPGGEGEVTYERWLAALLPDDRERARQRVVDGLASGHYADEYRVRHANGDVRWLRATGTAEHDADGKPTAIKGLVIDITEHKRAEETVARLAVITELSPDFVGWSDLEGQVVYVNPAGRRLCGLGETESLVGRSIVELVAPHERTRLLGEIRQATIDDGIWIGELDMIDRSGRIVPVSKVNILHRDASGRPHYMSTISRDVTRKKQHEEALRDADRRKDEFLATLAHELRNPLAPLQAAVGILEHMEGDDPRLRQLRGSIGQQTEHLTRLVDDLLDVSRIATGKLTLRRAPIAIADAVAAAVDMCKSDIQARGHHLEIALPSQVLHVDGDMVRLTQVLANLIGNAAKFTDNGGQIRVAARTDGDAVAVTVADTGCGIAADFLPKLFEAFSQAPASTQRAGSGLGLGLRLVRQIAEMHGGTVTAHSAGPGQGSTFEVRLPLISEASLPAPAADAVSQLKQVGIRVLVIDDYAAIRDSMDQLLTMKGYVVHTAADGQAAVAKAQVFTPDVVLLDLRMPGMSGYDVARILRTLPNTANARIVAMTGNVGELDRKAVQQAGFDDYVLKPVGMARLQELLAPRDKAAPGPVLARGASAA